MRLISLVAYFLISSKRSFRSRILCDTNEHRSSLDNEVNKSIKEEIKEIVNMYIKTPSTIPLETVNPTVLLEYSHIITKPGYYEEVMEDKLDECDTLEEIVQLEKVDLFLRKFIQTERKMRARLKLKYLMVGASTGRFEEAIQLLSDRYDTFQLKSVEIIIIKLLISNYVFFIAMRSTHHYYCSRSR